MHYTQRSSGSRRADSTIHVLASATIHVGILIGSEKPVPKEVDHREIAVRVQMVDEVKLLLAPEPSEARETRSCDVVLLVEIYVRVKRRRAGCDHYEV